MSIMSGMLLIGWNAITERGKMAEQLLSISKVSQRLSVSRRQFYRLRPRLIARGLQEVTIGHQRKFREASLDEMIRKAAEMGTAL